MTLQASASSTTASPSAEPSTATPQKEESNKEDVQESDPIPIGVSEPDERMRKVCPQFRGKILEKVIKGHLQVIDLSATPRLKPAQTTEIPPLTELIEEIGAENLITTTTEQVKSADFVPKGVN